jgi:hypothetical protein
MDMIQHLAIVALLAMILYLVYVNLFKDNSIKSQGLVAEYMTPQPPPPPTTKTEQGPVPVPLEHEPQPPSEISNRNTEASQQPGSSIFNPNATGILPQNQDVFEKQADFGSDVTNIRHFYKNNPEVFGKILGNNEVTNVADWERQSKEMFQNLQQKPTGPIQAFNYEDKFSSLSF